MNARLNVTVRNGDGVVFESGHAYEVLESQETADGEIVRLSQGDGTGTVEVSAALVTMVDADAPAEDAPKATKKATKAPKAARAPKPVNLEALIRERVNVGLISHPASGVLVLRFATKGELPEDGEEAAVVADIAAKVPEAEIVEHGCIVHAPGKKSTKCRTHVWVTVKAKGAPAPVQSPDGAEVEVAEEIAEEVGAAAQ